MTEEVPRFIILRKNFRKEMKAIIKLDKPSRWIKRYARPLEAARWKLWFENGSKEQVLESLQAFQNDDGGFGNGIEPDFWLPKSSPMATWAAGQILMEISADPNDPIVKSFKNYLVQTSQMQPGIWASVLPENNDYPHAPWWHYKEGVQENWMFNPSVELASYLVYWSNAGEEAYELGWDTIKLAIKHLFTVEEMDFHEVNNFMQMLKIVMEKPAAFEEHIAVSLHTVSEKIYALVDQCIEQDPSQWATGYKALPLDFIYGPNHPLYERYKHLVEQNIQFFLQQRTEDGIWDIPWEWGSYPEVFPIARRYWQGILAVNRYKVLKSFGVF